MSCNSQKIRTLRQQIPSFECVPGCHDCCGPVTTSPEEMSRLPRKTRAEQDAAMDELNCVHLQITVGGAFGYLPDGYRRPFRPEEIRHVST